MDNYYERTKSMRKKYLKYFSPGCKILDVGCGEGVLLQYLQDNGYLASGVDTDQKCIQAASARNLSVCNQDAIAFLQQNPDTYHGIIASHTIEHLPIHRLEVFVEACFRCLLEEGVLIVITPNVHTLTGCADFWNDPTHVRPFSLRSLEKLLAGAEFHHIEVGYDRDTTLVMRKDLLHWPLDWLRLITGVACYGIAAQYTELFAIARKRQNNPYYTASTRKSRHVRDKAR